MPIRFIPQMKSTAKLERAKATKQIQRGRTSAATSPAVIATKARASNSQRKGYSVSMEGEKIISPNCPI